MQHLILLTGTLSCYAHRVSGLSAGFHLALKRDLCVDHGEKGDNAPSGSLSDILCLAHPFPIDTLKPIYLCSSIKTIFSFA